jgi:hypothetical protein
VLSIKVPPSNSISRMMKHCIIFVLSRVPLHNSAFSFIVMFHKHGIPPIWHLR